MRQAASVPSLQDKDASDDKGADSEPSASPATLTNATTAVPTDCGLVRSLDSHSSYACSETRCRAVLDAAPSIVTFELCIHAVSLSFSQFS